MATNEITARATLQGDIKANVTLGVPVEVYVDREIYDGETEITPTEEDITLETAGKAVLDDILIHGVPTDPNVYEGEFEGTETGVLEIDTGYEGDSYPRMFNIYPADGIVDIKTFNAPKYALNTMSGIKITVTEPSYPNANTGAENQMRVAYVYKSSNVGFSSSSVSSYVFTKASNDGVLGVAAAIKMSDNRHMRLYVADDGETTFLATGIKYKYQVFY